VRRWILLLLAPLLLIPLTSCIELNQPSKPEPFPPPEGYASWDAYYEESYSPTPEPTLETILPPSEPKPEPTPPQKPEPEPELEISALCRIKNWSQDYWDYSEEWSDLVEIYIEIENTGDLDIDYYEIFYIVECSGGNDYYGMVNGSGIRVGKKDTNWTIKLVNGNEVLDIEIDDWELEHY